MSSGSFYSLLGYAALIVGLTLWIFLTAQAYIGGEQEAIKSAGTIAIAFGVVALIAGRAEAEEFRGTVNEYIRLRESFPALGFPREMPIDLTESQIQTIERMNKLIADGYAHKKIIISRRYLVSVEVLMIALGTLQTGYGDLLLRTIAR